MITNGIDVSQYQGIIDFEKVKPHVDFVIIRCGYGQDLETQDDTMFKRNADECTRLNIPFGVYIYSYAKNEIDALSEAKHVLRLINGYKLEYPVYYDLEDPQLIKLSNEQLAKNTQVFCDELENNNYYVGVYANLYWWRTKLTDDIYNKYTKWIAYYNDMMNFDGNYDMWQYSSTGFVEGIDGNVDLDYGYKDFPAIIKDLGLNELSSHNEKYKVGDHIMFDRVYISSDSTMPLIPYMNNGTITRIVNGARNPYLIDNGLGWVNEENIISNRNYLSNPKYQGDSFVNALDEINVDSSFDNRNRIAMLNGINNYSGSARQNLELLRLLKIGKLRS